MGRAKNKPKPHPGKAKGHIGGKLSAKPGTGSQPANAQLAALKQQLKEAQRELAARPIAVPAPAAVLPAGEPEPLPLDVPSAEEVASATAGLGPAARASFEKLLTALEGELGSADAARLWLVTPSAEFRSTPLAEVRAGHVAALLEWVEMSFGPGPAYG
jgi:hypothetical protein